jgi:hypothetical protein
VGEREQDVLRCGRFPVGEHERVRGLEQGRDLAGRQVAGPERHPVRQAELGDQLLCAAGPTPELPRNGQRDVGRRSGHGAQQHVEALVRPDDAEEQQAALLPAGVGLAGRENHRPFGEMIFIIDGGFRSANRDAEAGGDWQVRRHPRHDDAQVRGEIPGLGGLRGGMHDHRVHLRKQGSDQRDVAGPALMRQHVVADHDGARAAGPAAETGQDRQVGRHLERRQQREDHQVGGPEPAPGSDPAVRAIPGQSAVGARVRRAFRDVEGLPAGIEPPGVLGAPGLDDDVVARGGEPVREFGGVPRAASLVRVGRPDQRDPHVSPRERTIRSASRASEARIRPVTKIRIVSLAKCSGCTTRS